MTEIVAVKDKKELSGFIQLPFSLYKNDSNWVPPLRIDMKNRFNPQKNPYFEHSEVQPFVAKREGRIVGRITAHTNRQHNKTHHDKVGFFGFFECIDDETIAQALLDEAETWLKQKQCDTMRGPISFSVNEETGLLIEGFDSPPFIMMPHNFPYYQNLLEKCGLEKVMDLYAYIITVKKPPDKIAKLAEKLQKRGNFTIRCISKKGAALKRDIETVFEIYTKAWENNWGDVPLTKSEFEATVKQMMPIVRPEIVYIAEVDGKPAGFSLTLPDYNFVLKKMNGRIFPFGFLKALYYRNKIPRIRVLAMGVVKEFQNRGIDTVFYAKSFATSNENPNWEKAEFSWVLEINSMMNKIAVHLGGTRYKTYRIYDKVIQ